MGRTPTSEMIRRTVKVGGAVAAVGAAAAVVAIPSHTVGRALSGGNSGTPAAAKFNGCDPRKSRTPVTGKGYGDMQQQPTPQAEGLAANIANLQAFGAYVQWAYGETPPPGRSGVGDVIDPRAVFFSTPTPSNTQMTIKVFLGTPDLQGLYQSVIDRSNPNSPSYRCFVTPEQYKAKFAPSDKQVQSVVNWLKRYGLTFVDKPSNNLYVSVQGTAAQINKAFQTRLWDLAFNNADGSTGIFRFVAPQATVPVEFNQGTPGNFNNLVITVGGIEDVVDGHKPHGAPVVDLQKLPELLAKVNPKAVEAKLGGRVSFRNFAKQSAAKKEQLTRNTTRVIMSRFARSTAHVAAPPEPAFPSPLKCSPYWGAKPSGLPKLNGQELAWSNCGYIPSQLRAANGDNQLIAQGIDGRGKTFAIIDAYADPYLAKNQAEYRARHGEPALRPGQLRDLSSKALRALNNHTCDAPGWAGEENLDFIAGWTFAPAATGEYVGAQSCNDGDLLAAINTPVAAGNVDVISNSWGGVSEPTDWGLIQAYEQVAAQAANEGITILFSSGDGGNSLTDAGYPTATYPAGDPLYTAVGGVSQMIGKNNQMLGQVAWGTTKIPYSATNGKMPWETPGTWIYGGGGGPSWEFGQAWYEQGKVPVDLANNPYSLVPYGDLVHVSPAISQDADPNTGLLIGETAKKPNGKVGYVEFPIGGTSLASPLQAGLQIAADQANGDYGFVNPALYDLPSQATTDIVPATHPWVVAAIRDANLSDATDGYQISARELDQLSPWQYDFQYLGLPSDYNHSAFVLSSRTGYDNVTGNGVPNAYEYVELLGRGLGD